MSDCYKYIQNIHHSSLRSCNSAKNDCRCLYTIAEELSTHSVCAWVEIHKIYEIEIDMTQKYYYLYENTKCGSTTVSLLYILIMDMIFLVSFSMTE